MTVPAKKIKLDIKTNQDIKKKTDDITSTNIRKNSEVLSGESRILIQFISTDEEGLPALDLPLSTTPLQLHDALNALLNNDPPQPYTFQHNSEQILTSLQQFTIKLKNFSTETIFPIVYHPQSLYFIKPVTRWSSSMEGHTDAVLTGTFSPNGEICCTGSGDRTIRIWDMDTETPQHKIEGFKDWVLCLSINQDNTYLIAGDASGNVGIVKLNDNYSLTIQKGHKAFISSLCWEPYHRIEDQQRFLTASKDMTCKMWSLNLTCLRVFSGHSAAITKVLWSGEGLIFTSSEDRGIKVWRQTGVFVRELKGHAHWVNTMALSTDYTLRNGCFELGKAQEVSKQFAQKRYELLKGKGNERLVSGSDDFTLIIWDPSKNAKPLYRLTGHQAQVNHISYSPDGKYILSGAFDKCLKLWDGFNGTFVANFRGHVGSIYQVAWSADSRLCMSGSKDSTLKVWDIKTKKLMHDLPGHSDEIYIVDWSPDGKKVISGGKDKLVKIWKN